MKKPIGYYRLCDLLTMGSVCIAFAGMGMALTQHFVLSFLCLLLCGVCDAFDGVLARRRNDPPQKQTYGLHLDALADLICFGVLPAVITLQLGRSLFAAAAGVLYLLAALVRIAFHGALLARQELDGRTCLGLPTEASAAVYPVLGLALRLLDHSLLRYVMPALLLVLAVLFLLPVRIRKPDIPALCGRICNPRVIAFVLFPLFILLASDAFFKLNYGVSGAASALLATVTGHFPAFLFLWAYIALAVYALYCIFGGSRGAKICALAVMVVFLVVNDIKFQIMGNPIQLSDVNYLNADGFSMMGAAAGTIGPWIWKVLGKTLAVLLAGLVFLLPDRRRRFRPKKLVLRLTTLVLALGLLTVPLLLQGNAHVLSALYGLTPQESQNLPENAEMYYDYGLYQGLYLDALSPRSAEPEEYSAEKADRAVEEGAARVENTGVWGRANVVFLLSETFTDLQNNLPEATFSTSLTPNIDAYAQDGDKMVFDLLVPTYGGATVNTEFEVMTGSPMAFWRSAYIPYDSYYNDINGQYAPNLMREFNHNGYETMYMSPWASTLYRSGYVYDLFGATETKYDVDLSGSVKGIYYSDADLTEDIFNELKDTSEGHYKMILAASAENHYPYSGDKFDQYDVDVASDTLSQEDLGMIRAYAQGIYDADKALGELYEKIQTLDTPTILVFFGDHMPYISDSKGNQPYQNSAWFNTADEGLNSLRTYTTKAAIVANFPLKSEDLKQINANYLGAYVANRLDLELSDYFRYVDYARTVLPVFNRGYARLEDGSVCWYTLLPEDMNKVYQDYQNIRYRYFFDFLS